MRLVESIRDRIYERLPFKPPRPVAELLLFATKFLESELGQDLLLIQHFGSTADTPKNRARLDFKPPHRNSDIDLMVVVRNELDTEKIYRELSEKLKNGPLPEKTLELHVVNKSFYEAATLEGHPGLLLYAHAKEFGKNLRS